MIGVLVCIFGIMLVLTPAVMAAMAGVETEDDLIRWMMNQPLQFMIAARAMMISGVGLIIAGAAIYYLPL